MATNFDESTDAARHVKTFESLANQLRNYESRDVTEAEIIGYFTSTLPKEYDSVVSYFDT